MLAPLKLVSPLLKAPLLVTPVACAFIKARSAAAQITAEVQSLMQWVRGCLQNIAPGVKMPNSLGLEDRLTSGREHLIRDLVPEESPPLASHTTYIMQVPPVGPPPLVTTKKEVVLEEKWELQ